MMGGKAVNKQADREPRVGRRALGFKLFALVAGLLILAVAVELWTFEKAYRADLESSVVNHGIQVTELLKQATFQSMQAGHTDDLGAVMRDFGKSPGVVALSIYSKSGEVKLSSRADDVGRKVRMDAGACAVCHAPGATSSSAPKVRFMTNENGARVLGLSQMIENAPACSTGSCHGNNGGAKLLGVLDVEIALDQVDQARIGTRNRVVVTAVGLMLLTALLVFGFIRHSVNRPLSELVTGTRRLGEMDLRTKVLVHSRDELGELAGTFNTMVESLRTMVEGISDSSVQINAAAAQLFAASREQEQGAAGQSSAAEQTGRTMEGLVVSARQIAESTRQVLDRAEMTLEINKVGAERTRKLSQQTQRVTEMLENIKEIANRSEILALNAALEGAKAGEVGRGFSLVAAQMQRLAENVAESVKSIKGLVIDIRDATNASVLATEEGAKLAEEMTVSARRINLITQQQESATAEVSTSMAEVSQIGVETVSSSKQVASAAEQLAAQSDKLRQLVATFKLHG